MRAVLVGLLGAATLFAAGAAGQPNRPALSTRALVFLRNDRVPPDRLNMLILRDFFAKESEQSRRRL
jgi:hypothetical protein